MVVQCLMVSYENIHASNIIWTQQFIFRNMYVYTSTYMPTIIISIKEAVNLNESWEGYMGGFGGKKGKGENL